MSKRGEVGTIAFLLVLALALALSAPAGAKNLGLSDVRSVVWCGRISAFIMADGSLMAWGEFFNEKSTQTDSPVKLMDNVRSVAPYYSSN